jgi:hypothetical protein
MTHSKYQTPQISPPCVHYWDSQFIRTSFWIDWLVLKSQVEQFVPEIMVETESSEVEAHQIAWRAFIEATCGDEDTPMWEISGDFIRSLSEYNMAHYLIHLSVGSDVEDGFTVEEGIQRYIDWLGEERGNWVYGDFKVTSDLQIVAVRAS